MTDNTTPDEEIRPFLALVSKLAVGEKPLPIRFMYKTVPANLRDTGWRMYTGYEDPDFLADKLNMMPYPVETLTKMDGSLEEMLNSKPGSVWERAPGNPWQAVDDFEIPVEEDPEHESIHDLDEFETINKSQH